MAEVRLRRSALYASLIGTRTASLAQYDWRLPCRIWCASVRCQLPNRTGERARLGNQRVRFPTALRIDATRLFAVDWYRGDFAGRLDGRAGVAGQPLKWQVRAMIRRLSQPGL